jgi:hypothetical protein
VDVFVRSACALIQPPLLVTRDAQMDSNGVRQIIAYQSGGIASESCVPEAVTSQC